jgi:hypothetical protein
MRQKCYKQKQTTNADCKQFDETAEHVVTSCPILAKEHDIKRRDRVCAELRFNMCKEMGVKLDNEQWYDHIPKSVETSHEGNVTILWNQQVLTDRTIPNNKTDIIIRYNNKGTCISIAVANPGDRNVIKKEAEKSLKYKPLMIEIQRMWNVKAKVTPAITGTISESLRQYLSHIPSKREIKELQKTAILCTAQHTAGSANAKVHNIFHGRNNITCSTNCKYRTAATLYALETLFVSVYYCKYPA